MALFVPVSVCGRKKKREKTQTMSESRPVYVPEHMWEPGRRWGDGTLRWRPIRAAEVQWMMCSIIRHGSNRLFNTVLSNKEAERLKKEATDDKISNLKTRMSKLNESSLDPFHEAKRLNM